jgi:probable F420-dependent oxidoreductase
VNKQAAARGVLAMLDKHDVTELTAYVRQTEALGYDSFWIPELFGREPFVTAAHLLAHSHHIAIATGIANIYVRDAHAIAQARHTLAELSGGRFILGVGVSNLALNDARGHAWQPPLIKMTAFLDKLANITVQSCAHGTPAPLILAAHGPQLQLLGAARCDGVLTYLMSVEHTRRSRERLGADAELNVVCAMLAQTDATAARRIARKTLAYYLTLDYYHREWRKLGYTDTDFSNGGSDRLIDMLVGWGDGPTLEARLAAHVEAGASRVIIMPIDPAPTELEMHTLQVLAPGV